MPEKLTKQEYLNGAPINDFSAIPADADLRALIFVRPDELSEYQYDTALDYCEGR